MKFRLPLKHFDVYGDKRAGDEYLFYDVRIQLHATQKDVNDLEAFFVEKGWLE